MQQELIGPRGAEVEELADERDFFAAPGETWLPVPLASHTPEPGQALLLPPARPIRSLSAFATAATDLAAVEAGRGGRFLLVPICLGVGAIAYFLAPLEPPA